MTTQYTSLLGFALPVTGELNGTWGDVVNDSVTQLVEDSVAGKATASVTSGDWTLTTTGSGAANQARCAILVPTGTPGVSRNIIAPSSSKAYIVVNQSDAAVVLKGSATTGVTVSAGSKVLCAWNGTDFVQVGASGTVTSVSVATANGFAGTSSGGSTPALTLTTSVSGILKGNGTAISAASSGTDYAPATSGSSILYGNGSGGFSNVSIGSGVSFAGGTLSSTAIGSYPGSGIAVSTGSAWGTSKASPAGDIVGTSDSQVLTNKTIGMSGALDCNNNVVLEIKTATFNSQSTIATTSGAITVDWTSAQNQLQTEPTGTITYTFTAPPGPCHLQLIIDSDGTSTAQTINWPGTVTWMGSTWAGENDKSAVINFWYSGSKYYAVGTNQV